MNHKMNKEELFDKTINHYIGHRDISHEEWIDSHKKKRKAPHVRQLPYYRRYETKLY